MKEENSKKEGRGKVSVEHEDPDTEHENDSMDAEGGSDLNKAYLPILLGGRLKN